MYVVLRVCRVSVHVCVHMSVWVYMLHKLVPTSSLNFVVSAISLFVLCEYVGIMLITGALGAALLYE